MSFGFTVGFFKRGLLNGRVPLMVGVRLVLPTVHELRGLRVGVLCFESASVVSLSLACFNNFKIGSFLALTFLSIGFSFLLLLKFSIPLLLV